MNVFSESSSCPKCGYEKEIKIKWCAGFDNGSTSECICIAKIKQAGRHNGGLPVTSDSKRVRQYRKDHLERSCGRCTYRWAQRPLDAAAPLEQLAAQAK